MDRLGVSLVLSLTTVLICILVVGYAPFSPFSPFEGVWREEIDIREEIGKLRTPYGGNYSIQESDWEEWSSQMGAAEGNFTKANSWEEFKTSLENHGTMFLMFDEEERVVWFNPPLTNQIIYFEY